MTNNSGIYKITNKVTGEFYIGSSVDLYRRLNAHRFRLAGGYHINSHLQNAWNKYGADGFSFETVLYCDIESLLYYEQVLLDGLKSTYNIAKIAGKPMLGRKHTEEAKRKISEAFTGALSPNFGKHFSDETKRKMSEARHKYFERVREESATISSVV